MRIGKERQRVTPKFKLDAIKMVTEKDDPS